MLQYIVKRLLGLLPTLLIVGVLVFLFVHLLPGDPARLAAGPDADPGNGRARAQGPRARPAAARSSSCASSAGVAARRLRHVAAHQAPGRHRDRRALHADVLAHRRGAWRGRSLFGMAIGIVSAVWRNRWPDRLGMTLAVSGISFPAFALGMVLMQIFSVQLGWLPTVGDDTLAALHPAVDHARRRRRRDHGAVHALVVRRHPRRGLHPHRARQGPATSRTSSSSTGCATR